MEINLKKIKYTIDKNSFSRGEKINILHLNGRSDIGGGPQNMFRLISYLDKNIYNLFVVCPEQKPFFGKLNQIDNINVIPLNLKNIRFKNLFVLMNLIKKSNIRLIHSHGKAAGLWSRILKLFFPSLIIIHQYHGIHYLHYNGLSRFFYFIYESLFSLFTTANLFVSDSEFKEAKSKFFVKKNSELIIHNGVEIKTCKFTKKEIREKLNIPQEKYIGISVIRFSFPKNLKATLEIISKFKDFEQKYHFIIIGSTDDISFEEISSLVHKKKIGNLISLPGERNDVNDWLYASDYYISTSKWEGMPLSVLEAMSTGLPVIGSDVVGNNSIIKNNFNGFLLPLDNLNQFKQKILELKSDRKKSKIFSKNSIQLIQQNYTIDKMVSKYDKLYKSF